MSSESHAKVLVAVKKSKGMLEKIESMLADKQYCADIAQQINATIGLLRSANAALFENHLQTCGVAKIQSGDPAVIAELSQEIMRIWSVTQRS
jgi:DNA-binding FrmR family transcriptional regulator